MSTPAKQLALEVTHPARVPMTRYHELTDERLAHVAMTLRPGDPLTRELLRRWAGGDEGHP